MAKTTSIFVCQTCGATHVRWIGRCTECGEWNTVVEETIAGDEGSDRRAFSTKAGAPVAITASGKAPPPRIPTGADECDRVLGGGIVPGSITLIGGDPGIGKSTLMLQIARQIAETAGPVLYVSGEESFDQTRMRARRLGALTDGLFLLTETSVEVVQKRIEEETYGLIIVDSIQSVYAPALTAVPGSVSQVRECANEFLRIAKGTGVPVFLVGHVTKDGAIAGPRLLEHLVDTVLYFEGEGKQSLRILRAVKNRFGSTNEIGVFEMGDDGLREVANPSALFLDERPTGVSGSVVIPSVEGTRPVLVEVQALVGESYLPSPRRTVTGVNANRVSLILAVLEKRAGVHFANKDVFVNVAGGLRLEEPAADLAIAVALVSSLLEVPVAPSRAVFGEVGLAGEVRAVSMVRQRVAEAAKFGFSACILPEGGAKEARDPSVQLLPVSSVKDAIDLALER